MTTTHPVDSSITQGAGIPDDALDALVAATIPDRDDTTVPAPPGAIEVGDWSDTADRTYTFREFAGEFFPALPGRDWLGARVTGHQYVANDGSEVTSVYLVSPVAGAGNGALPSQAVALAAAIRQASERAAALQAEADELAERTVAVAK